jgi:hypothetical protein
MTIDYKSENFGSPIPGTRFSINQITHSDTAIREGILNLPPIDMLHNLENLARMLTKIWDQIGPFSLASGYRTPELQAALRKVTPQAAMRSWHVKGLAADIQPLSGDAEPYFAKLLASPLYNQLGEVALKTDPNPDRTIHFSLGKDYGGIPSKAMKVISGKYYTMDDAERVEMMKQFGYVTGGLFAAIAIGVAAYFITVKIQQRTA